jgi:hypothetical protein
VQREKRGFYGGGAREEKARVCRRGSEVGIKREEERLMCSVWSLQVEKEIMLSAWPCDQEKHASCVARSEKRKERILSGFGPRRKQARKRGTETF